jgi:ferric-dicitrate binding protein FerR (iron transport regulator)
MKDYQNLRPEELAADSFFQQWSLSDDPAAEAFWNEWVTQHPDQKEVVEKAQLLLTSISREYGQSAQERVLISDAEIQNEVRRLHQSLNSGPMVQRNWFRFAPVQYGIAASLLLLGLFGWYILRPDSAKRVLTYNDLIAQATSTLAEVTNATDKPLLVNLPDKSTILLYPKSRVSYAKPFLGTKREVYLAGEAFFNVAKNPSRPFYVYADNLVTKVLGTSFVVKTDENTKQVKVVVKTGRVSVYAQDQVASEQKEDFTLSGTVLTPNQQVVFSTEDTRLVKSLVNDPVLVQKEVHHQPFTFKRTPIADVFATLEKAYNITIVFDKEVMKDCYLTASLAEEPLFDKLNLICHTINAHYDQLDAYIVIDSKGCK